MENLLCLIVFLTPLNLDYTKVKLTKSDIKAIEEIEKRIKKNEKKISWIIKEIKSSRLPLYILSIPLFESRFNFKAKGKSGDYGLWQLNQKTFKLPKDYLLNYKINTLIALHFIKKIYKKNSFEDMLCMYNANKKSPCSYLEKYKKFIMKIEKYCKLKRGE